MTFLSARLVILFTRARDGQNVAPQLLYLPFPFPLPLGSITYQW